MLQRAFASIVFTFLAQAQAQEFDTSPIERATGIKGVYYASENVYRISKPRDNMATIAGWKIPPFLGTTSDATFSHLGYDQVMMTADHVLFEDEVGPTMNVALKNGLEITALHNHFLFEQPRLFFMHMRGIGYADKMATAIKKVWEASEQVRSRRATPPSTYAADPVPEKSDITVEPLERILGKQGEANNGMFKVSYSRPVKFYGITMGLDVGDAMRVNTWAGFAGTDAKAVVNGSFVVMESELQSVLRSLRKSGINVVAINQRMTQEVPRLLFIHYWGQGKARDLARAVRAAVDLTGTRVR